MYNSTSNNDVVEQVLDECKFTVSAVKRLCEITGCSVVDACYELASHAPARGVFVLLDANGTVIHAVPMLGFIPPKRNSDQHEMSIYAAARNNRHGVTDIMRDDVQVKYSTGSFSQNLYGQAIVMGDNLLVVLALTGNAPWIYESPEQHDTGVYRYGTIWPFTCKKCGGVRYETGCTYCRKCGHLRCPKGHCQCEPTSRVCTKCFQEYSIYAFRDGSSVCKECEGLE